jgi:hypothetical protein
VTGATPTLVCDASALSPAAAADRVDVIADLAKPFRNVTTAAVLQELAHAGLDGTALAAGWLEVVHVDGLS